MSKKNTETKSSLARTAWEVIKAIPLWIWTLIGGFIIGTLLCLAYSSGEQSKDPHDQFLISGQSYQVNYNSKMKSPTWILQVLSSESIKKIDESQYRYFPNPDFSKSMQPQISDFEDTDFGIGQLITPTNRDEIKKIFYLTNVVPQNTELKRGYWKKLNKYVQNLTKADINVAVISGPLYLLEEESEGMELPL